MNAQDDTEEMNEENLILRVWEESLYFSARSKDFECTLQ